MSDTTEKETGTSVAVVEANEVEARADPSTEVGWSGAELGQMMADGQFIYGRESDIIRMGVSLACWEVISQDVAKTPLQLRRRTELGSELVQPNEHPVARLLWRRPSRYYDWFTWLRMAAAYLAATRQYYIAPRYRPGVGYVEIQGINPGCVNPLTNVAAGRYVYDVQPSSDHERIQWSWCSGRQSDEVVFPILLRTLNGIDPLSNTKLMKDALDVLAKMQQFQLESFANGGIPVYAISFPDGMKDDQFDRLKRDMENRMKEAIRTGKPIILEGNGNTAPTVTKLSMSATENDFVKAQSAAANEVLRYYRMPPHKVMIFDSVKYDNLSAINRLYVDDTLVPIFDSITSTLDHALLSDPADEDLFFAFDKDFAYNLDPKERQEITEKRWKAGMITHDEMRQQIGMNQVGGILGTARMISGNFMFVDPELKVLLKAGGNAPGAEGDQAPQDDAGNSAAKE